MRSKMAGSLLCVTRVLFLFLLNSILLVSSGSINNKPVPNVPEPLIRSALNSLNQDSPTHHTYLGGNLISAQKLEEPPYTVYRLTFDLTPICKESLEPCPREACTVEVKQHELGDINVLRESIQCMYLYPQSVQDDPVQQTQENNNQEQAAETADKQMTTNESVELDHEIQKNGEHVEKPFIATRASSNPSYCPGCPYELNPNLPGLAAFGEQVSKSMDESVQNDYKYKVVDIAKVTRSVSPTSNVIQYKLLLRVGESDCLKNAVEQSECSLQVDRPIKTCLVTIEERPRQQFSRRITKNNCTADAEQSVMSLDLAEFATVEPRQEEGNSEKLDALKSLKEILDNFTYNSMKKMETPDQSEVTEQPMVKRSVDRSSKNDVADREPVSDGSMTVDEYLAYLNLPRSSVNWAEDTNNAKEDAINAEEMSSRRKRAAQVGAPNSQNVNDPEIQQLAQRGLKKFSEDSEGSNEPIIVEVVEASKQIVSGTLYKIRVKLGSSTCLKGTKDNCELKEGSELKDCLFTIWSQPWIDQGSPKITINCDVNNRRKRALKGSRYNEKMLKLAQEIKDETLFEDFMKKYNISYLSAEEKQDRFKVFKQNLKVIEELQTYERGSAEYGVTIFADLTPKEFKARYLGFRPDLKQDNEIPLPQAEIPDITLPPKFDWREHGVVTPVKDQGMCGSCWAFSVTGNVEGQYAIKHKDLLSLSEQELVDCDTTDEGCNGGLMENAYKAIEQLGGLELEKDYPYDARNEKCHFAKDEAKVQVVSAVNITSNETKMAQWLVQNGPISVAINANAMQFYVGGVSHPFNFLCNPKNLDHGVLIVGYGTSKYPLFHKKLPYWLIKNSWGQRWGERGYYRVYRGDGTCGVNTDATSAVVA